MCTTSLVHTVYFAVLQIDWTTKMCRRFKQTIYFTIYLNLCTKTRRGPLVNVVLGGNTFFENQMFNTL